jgi:hypothetical protein
MSRCGEGRMVHGAPEQWLRAAMAAELDAAIAANVTEHGYGR